MKPVIVTNRTVIACIVLCTMLFSSCEPTVKLSASWINKYALPQRYSKVLVMAFGNDIAKRKLGEDHLKSELARRGFTAVTSLGEFGPEFAKNDSTRVRNILLQRQFDAVVTLRVVNIDQHDRWVPKTIYYGPTGFYRGFYGYYYHVWDYYGEGYVINDVEVLLESNLYNLSDGMLRWAGQSRSFTMNPTDIMAARYARDVVQDMMRTGMLLPPQ